ncbi:MAG: GNAT family N-acetyltransferase [Pseudomonadota bacterium]
MRLRAPREDEAEALGALCLRSKGHWGYDAAFMAACRAELAVAPRALRETWRWRAAEIDGALAGVAEIEVEGEAASLERLFVDPPWIGRAGLGRALMDWAAQAARGAGARWMEIEADPGAEAFYRRMGAAPAGWAPSASIAGRRLPRLRLDLGV